MAASVQPSRLCYRLHEGERNKNKRWCLPDESFWNPHQWLLAIRKSRKGSLWAVCIADTYIQDQYLGTKEFYLKLCLPYSSVKWPFFINNGDSLFFMSFWFHSFFVHCLYSYLLKICTGQTIFSALDTLPWTHILMKGQIHTGGPERVSRTGT